MSNIFYNYLSDKIIKYFQINTPESGEKFYVQFEAEEQVETLYGELSKNTIAQAFVYEDKERNQEYSTYELRFGSVKLIIAAAMKGGPHPDFLATMRNLVGVEEGYTQKAILFIHCSSLDSILGGAGSLSKEGMPLNIAEIEIDIKRKINETGYSIVDKKILEQHLENKKKELEGTTASIFEYEDIIDCLGDTQITADEYKKFELFPDDTLVTLSEKELEKRLKQNHKNFVNVSEVHSYGSDNGKLENMYGEDGAKALLKPDWEMLPFVEIEKFIASKKNKSTIEYLPILTVPKIWDREEGRTKAKSRIRNILVFIDDGEDSAEFTLEFTEFTKSAGIEILKAFKSIVECSNSGKKINVKISNVEDKTVFVRFKYSDDGVKFDFRIAVLRVNMKYFDSIKTKYSVEVKNGNNSAIRINTEDDEVLINAQGINKKEVQISEIGQVVSLEEVDALVLTVNDNYPGTEESEDVHFSITTENFVIPIIKAFSGEKPTVIEGMKLWYMKRTRKCNFEVQGDNSLVFGTKNYYARGEFKKSLDLEKKYIKKACPFVVEKAGTNGELEEVEISLPIDIRNAFDAIVNYFNQNSAIPSLVYVNKELEVLYRNYIISISGIVGKIAEGAYLTEEEKGVFSLGMIKRQEGDGEIFLTPLHPINIAYQLFINTQDIDGLGDDEYDLIRRFQQTSLLPYINIDPYTKEKKIYIPVEQVHSPEWKIYVEEELPRYKGSKDFVSKLVAEKIREFVEHFNYLFLDETTTPIRINLINTGDCKEIVQGIVKYYAYLLNEKKSKHVIPIQVTMYADEKVNNAFEVMSKIDNPDMLVQSLEIEAKVEEMSMEEIIDVYRNNVCFYCKQLDEEFQYAHITFMELDDDHQAITTGMNDIPSGVVMNGIASGTPSEMLGDSYRTGFGIRYMDTNSMLMQTAIKFNAINAALNGDAYRSDACFALKMGLNKQKILDRVYDASNWVTFINPKVDLNYFKNDTSSKDLLIIHYSDQYNMTSSGYDAITVTKKSKQYQKAICRYLTLNGVDEVELHSKRIINMFNALNGDWLLRMLSYKSHFPVEKLSILSAMKLEIKRYSAEGVIWVPVSLEEILRVSGSVGLAKSGSIFSAKNLGFEGLTSDDLLLVGIRDGEKVQVTFYPVEVKIGKVPSNYLEKGITQALQTRKIFDTILGSGECLDKDIKTRLYRNFFMQQVMVNAEKMQIYEVGDETQNWDKITRSELRRKLLNEEYEIVDALIPQMGKAGVISFREECNKEREIRNQDVLIIEKTKKEGVNLLAKEFNEIDAVDWALIEETTVLVVESEEGIIEKEDDEVLDETVETKTELEDEQSIIKDELEVSNDNEIRVLIGEDRYNHKIYWEFGNKALANRHLLITGTSGQGKTYSIQTMLYELAEKNVSSVIFDYTEGFTFSQLETQFTDVLGNKINQHIVYNSGVPINPFKRHEIEIAGQKILEKESQVAARLADIFSHVYDFGAQQYSAIFEAALNGLNKYGDTMSMKMFQSELEEVVEQNKAAKSVISKMSPFFHTVEFKENAEFDWSNILYAEEARVNIMQLTAFTREMQVAITELMLWDAWYFTKKYGTKEKPFVVVLDEAQNLSHTMKSPSAAILTEGRKFGWSAWFATQSLKVLKDDEVVRLLQAAFKLYFKPTDDEMVKIAKQLDLTGKNDWLSEVQKLQKGQCIAVGDKMKANGTVGPSEPSVTKITDFSKRV